MRAKFTVNFYDFFVNTDLMDYKGKLAIDQLVKPSNWKSSIGLAII